MGALFQHEELETVYLEIRLRSNNGSEKTQLTMLDKQKRKKRRKRR
jgi:hypothetical protein